MFKQFRARKILMIFLITSLIAAIIVNYLNVELTIENTKAAVKQINDNGYKLTYNSAGGNLIIYIGIPIFALIFAAISLFLTFSKKENMANTKWPIITTICIVVVALLISLLAIGKANENFLFNDANFKFDKSLFDTNLILNYVSMVTFLLALGLSITALTLISMKK